MHEMIQLLVSFTGSLGFAVLFNIHGKKTLVCGSWRVPVMGSLSYSRDMDIQSIYLWFLVNGDNYFVCRMYGTDSQDSGYSVSCLGNDSADSGSCPVPDHELDDDAGVG